MTATHESAIDGAKHIGVHMLAPSPTNPRKHFDDAFIKDLAASIKKVGVMQPIVARPRSGARAGEPQYEIVAGESRWRASKVAGLDTIPALARELSDLEVMELQLLENLKRRDLHPLEEARGYEQMLLNPPHGKKRLQGYTVEQLAEKAGVSQRQIWARIQLLQLIPDGQAAMLDGRLSASVALLIARMPSELQGPALEEVLRGWAGEPFSYRAAAKMLRDRYMLTLSKAVFDIKDASLLPKAGACSSCPKRTGANPDLFEDVDSADVCTDPPCFEEKRKAHGAAMIEQAKTAGQEVLTGAAAKKIMPHGEYSLQASGYVRLDRPAEDLTGTKKQLQTLVGDALKPTLVQTEHMDLPIPVVKVDEAKAALKTKGLLAPPQQRGVGVKAKTLTPDDIRRQRSSRIQDRMQQRAPGHLWAHLSQRPGAGLPGPALTMIVQRLSNTVYGDWDGIILEAAGLHKRGTGRVSPDELDRLLNAQSLETLANVALMYLAADMIENNTNELELEELAKALKWPAAKLVKEITAEVDSAIRDEIDQIKQALKPEKKPATPAAKPSKKSGSARAAGVSTPSISAAAQGAKTDPKTPIEALQQAVKRDANGQGKKGQKDEPEAKPTSTAKKPATGTPKAPKQEDKPEASPTTTAQPKAQDQAKHSKVKDKPAAPTNEVPAVGERWRVRADAARRAKTQGREGAVESVDVIGKHAILRWGPKPHEIGRYEFSEIERAAAPAAQSAFVSPVAAWPFPKDDAI